MSNRTGRSTTGWLGRGMVRYEQHEVLGRAVVMNRWSVQDSPYGVEMRRRVIQALVERTPPDTRGTALIALPHTIPCETKIVGVGHWDESSREIEARGQEIASSSWAPEAVREAIDAMIVAINSEAGRRRG